MTDEKRELGPEMKAEEWVVIGDEFLMWLHSPTRHSVTVDGCKRIQCAFAAAYPWEPSDADASGYLVSLTRHDELGNPMPATSKQVWVESYGNALRLARGIRRNMLEPTATTNPRQLTFDDLLERGAK